jgi:hypothetical protein
MTQFILRSLVLLLFVTLLTQCSRNASNANNAGVRANTVNTGPIADPPKIEGDQIEAYLVYKADLAYLQTIPPPPIRFVFRAGTVMMPSSAKDIVTAHWKKALDHYFNDYFNKPKDASELNDRALAWKKYCSETDKKFQEVSIPAPDGTREIKLEEARDVRAFINKSAEDVINLAKSPPTAITPQN